MLPFIRCFSCLSELHLIHRNINVSLEFRILCPKPYSLQNSVETASSFRNWELIFVTGYCSFSYKCYKVLPTLGVWWSTMLFQLCMSQYGFSKFYGYVVMKSTLLPILIHNNISTFFTVFSIMTNRILISIILNDLVIVLTASMQ